MSQQIRVLQCVECSLYQVDIVKKSNKWDCNVCRQKQNVLREFFRGSGAECRLKVQELNLDRGQKCQAEDHRKILKVQQALDAGHDYLEGLPAQRPSKWAAFVDKPNGRDSDTLSNSRIANQLDDDSSGNNAISFERTTQRVRAPSKWAAFVEEPINRVPKLNPVERRNPQVKCQDLDFDELENTYTNSKRSGHNKRKSQDDSMVNKNPYSKWQKFL